jgi:predicted dehydrogenase
MLRSKGNGQVSEHERLHVGLVGCGNHGGALAQAIVRTDALRLVACADPDERAVGRAAALAGDVAAHASLDALLATAAVDAVIIATPHHLLAPLALASIRAGKHTFVEKPLALNEAEAKEIEFAAASADVTCMAGYSFRFSMASYVHDLLAQGVVGEIQAISGAIGHGPMDRGWQASPETGGGPLLYVGCHLIDLLLWFVGDEPVRVFADVRRRSDTGTDATSAIQLGFDTGVVAQLLVTQAAPSFFYELHIVGRAGSITLRGRNFLQFEIEVLSNAVRAYREPTIIRPQIRRDNISMMLVPELEEFAAAVQEQRPPSITASDGRRVLRVLDAVAESGRSGQAVALDLPVLAAY